MCQDWGWGDKDEWDIFMWGVGEKLSHCTCFRLNSWCTVHTDLWKWQQCRQNNFLSLFSLGFVSGKKAANSGWLKVYLIELKSFIQRWTSLLAKGKLFTFENKIGQISGFRSDWLLNASWAWFYRTEQNSCSWKFWFNRSNQMYSHDVNAALNNCEKNKNHKNNIFLFTVDFVRLK